MEIPNGMLGLINASRAILEVGEFDISSEQASQVTEITDDKRAADDMSAAALTSGLMAESRLFGELFQCLAQQVTMTTFTLLTIVVILYTLHKWPVWNRKGYPPGPLPLPFLGHSHWFYSSSNVFKRIYDLSKDFGDVVTLDVNVGKIVVLNSAEAIHEAFVKNAKVFSDRPAFMLNPATGGYGLVHEKNGRWKDLRKHALGVFRHHKNSVLESIIQDELKHFLHVLEEKKGKPFDIKEQLTQTVSNVITSIIFGNRFDYSPEQLSNLQITEFRDVYEKTKFMPAIRYAPLDPSGYRAAERKHAAGLKFAEQQIEGHKKSGDMENPKDYIEHYLVEMSKREADPYTQFHDLNLKTSVMSLYLAGTDTTSSQLYWAFLYMVLYPEIQEKIREEIRDHIGERKVTYADRNSMHYTMAVMTELLRIGIALSTLLHVASDDVEIQGKTIPKDTPVYGNVWGPLHDPSVYPDPDTFKPERFLDTNGKFAKPDPKYFTAFSSGRRTCLGEPLARTELFILLVGTLQKYQVDLGQQHRPSEEGKRWFVWIPAERFKLSFQPLN
ncbi:cytochrome P450 2B19-like [Watersipora subatra]|uniref:cytochrome P450 2B19-like n=1 Tax=Watersipora subatra TaxID=2589382 RepID=UPI00355AEBCF